MLIRTNVTTNRLILATRERETGAIIRGEIELLP